MTILNLIIKHKLFALNDFWKYQYLTFKIHSGSITLSLYIRNYNSTCVLQYSDDNGRNWNTIEAEGPLNSGECKAKYTIGTFDNSVKLRGNVLSKIGNLNNQWGVFSVKCNNGATYDVCGNPASLYSRDSFASVRTIDLSNLFANKVKISDDELYYDDNKLSWKDSGENLIFTKESSDIKYGGESVYGDNGLQSIKNLWLLHPNGTYTNMFIGSNVKTITDYMPISGKCEGMFYHSQITSNDLKLLLPNIQIGHIYEGMFAYCPNIKNITINNIQNEDVYAGMFLGCSNLEKINVTYSNITNSLSKTIKSMFFECSKINLFNITLNNISVPVFDEYFRFTIPNTLTDCSNSVLNILNSGMNSQPTSGLFKNSKIEKSSYIKFENSSIHCLFKDANYLKEINTIETDGQLSNLFYDSSNRPSYENIQSINYSKYTKGANSGNTIDYNYVKEKRRKTPLTIYTNSSLTGKIVGGNTDNVFYNTINILLNLSYEEIESLPNDLYSTYTLFSLPYTWSIPNLKISIHVASGNQLAGFFFKQGWVGGDYYIHGNYQWTGDGYFSVIIQALDSNPFISILTNEDESTNYIKPILTGYFKNTRFPDNRRRYSGEFGYSPIGIFINSNGNWWLPISEITVEIKNNNEYELVSRYIPIKFTGTGLSNKFGFKDTIKNITYII